MELEEKCSTLESDRSDAFEEKETLLQVIQNRTADLTKLKSQEEKLLSEHRESHQQLSQVTQQLEQCNLELHTLRERCNELSHMYAMKEVQLNEECKQRMFLQQVENELRVRLNELHLQNQEISSQLDVFNEMNINYEDTISHKDKEKRSLMEQIQKLHVEMSELKSSLDTVEGRRDIIEKEIRQELDSVSDKLRAAEEERDTLRDQFTTTKYRAEQSEKSLANLQNEHSSITEKYAKVQESKQLMQQTLLDQLNKERDTINEKNTEIENLKETITQLQTEQAKLQLQLEDKQKHREAAKTKKKILKKIAKKKDKVEVLDESQSMDKENDLSIVSIISSKSDCCDRKIVCDSSILSDTNNSLNCSSLSNASTLKSYGQFDNYHSGIRQPLSTANAMTNSLPISSGSYQQQQHMMNTSIHSANSSIIYPSPMAYSQAMYVQQAQQQQQPIQMVNHHIPHPQMNNQRYVGVDGKPMDLFEIAYQGNNVPSTHSSLLLDNSMTQYGGVHGQSFTEYDMQPQRERYYHQQY